ITASNYIIYGHMREGPRAIYDPYTLYLMSSGIRPTLNNPPADDGRDVLIWLFGGSTMRGSSEDDGKTMASQLALRLNSGEKDRRFRVVNLGMDSFNSLMETKFLQKMLIESPRPPRLIVFYDGANEATYFLQGFNPYGHHGYRRVESLIESYYHSWFGALKPLNSALYGSFTLELYDKIHQTVLPVTMNNEQLDKLVTITTQRYEFIQKTAGCYGADFLLVWQPILWIESCQPADEVRQTEGDLVKLARFLPMRENISTVYRTLEKNLGNRPYFNRFGDVLCGRQKAAYLKDGVHLTDDGDRLIAEALAKLIKDKLTAAHS
ncbi:MAG: SGNH/GDSL hydrolase family protein, partial [Deltaproteobacteria bacterium]|nr:SGNH/GDSL hydrolase family protein [Deltaproteobacteria bacterium]